MFILKEKPIPVAEGHHLLLLEAGSRKSAPGQFVNVRVADGYDPLLRRPFSIFSHEGTEIGIVVKTVGRGTGLLSAREPGSIDVIGPLGRGFSLGKGRILIAGGGVGNAPLHYLALELAKSGCDITYLYGARSAGQVFMIERFRQAATRLIVVTNDGSAGERGMVTDLTSRLISEERFDRIYACGPAPMMRAVASLSRGIPLEVSVENYFGCGTGLCSGCSIDTDRGPRRACLDGPVFDGASIQWETMPV
ncbi:MAG: dihydroorotate dehydrogenase electron transfer subunit [Spirochaetes bacterium]|nr:dihydroorotate dehydrogenase electron transfer subunit [Spirochaetota bacterium]